MKKRSITIYGYLFIGLILLFHDSGTIPLAQTPVDLGDWTAQTYPQICANHSASGNWDVAANCESVLQKNNGLPSFYCSDFPAFGATITGKIKVTTTSDNDFIGFALGFQPGDQLNPSADYLLVDWKQGHQDIDDFRSPCHRTRTHGVRGLAVSRVYVVSESGSFEPS